MRDPLSWQLADSAFPSGGFAHSFGFEALRALGYLRDEAELARRLDELAWQTAYAVLPFTTDAYTGDAVAADTACHQFLTNHIANRGSRAQGRAFVIAIEAVLENTQCALPHNHLPVVLGASLRHRLALDELRELAMYGALRSATSAAVRLGVVGPLRAQRLLLEASDTATRALTTTRHLHAGDACTVSPIVELAQAAHDRLYARLFQS